MKKPHNLTAGEPGLQLLPDMNHIGLKIQNLTAYGITIAGITFDIDLIQRSILFVGGMILLYLQIKLHRLKIKNEKRNYDGNKD